MVCGGGEKWRRMTKTIDAPFGAVLAMAAVEFWQVLSPDPSDYRITKCI